MNAYRSIGLIGLATGAMALILIGMPDAWASTWLVETVANQFRSDVVLNLFGVENGRRARCEGARNAADEPL